MTNKILKAILMVATVVLVASLITVMGVLYPYFGNLQKKQLKDELHLAASATEKLGEAYLKGLETDEYRLTWIGEDGTVLFDSHADMAIMENHANREEIKEALVAGEGSSTRHSSTLTEKTIYEAIRLNDGSVLRISISRVNAFILVLGMIQPITFVAIFAFVLSLFLAKGMAKQVVEPLNQLNLDTPLANDVYEELTPLLHRIHDQQIEIKFQMHALKQKQEEFEQITENMNEALILLDDNRRVLSINRAAKKMFRADGTCIGEDFSTVDRKQEMFQALDEARNMGHASLRTKKNGKVYQFDFSNRGTVILAYDITEQVNAEENRREFTANVSHELKTPLQSIIGSSELIESGMVKEKDLPRFVGHIRKEASRLVGLIEDIIRLSQLDSKLDMEQEEVSLCEIGEDVFEVLNPIAKMNQVDLQVSGNGCYMTGSRRMLYEIVYNLCDNAIKYNHIGGHVAVSFLQKEDEICLQVTDDGIGIAPEYHEKIFERFYRVDKSHSKQSGGTGLGLSIVKNAVQYHNGKIEVDSELGRGTKISIYFKK